MSGLVDKESHDTQEAARVAAGIRRRVLEHTIKNNGGYLSQACSSAEILATLFTRVMNLGKVDKPILPSKFAGVPGQNNSLYRRGDFYNGPRGQTLDRFFLSPTHYSLVLYAVLVETRRMDKEGFKDFNKDGGILEMIGAEHSPGMEVMTGSLGQGISQAAGIALARKLKGDTGKNWVFMSDGELQPGQVWEALQCMSFYKLDNMGIYVDVNGQQCDGKTSDVMGIEPLQARFEAFGCEVYRVNGHDLSQLAAPASLPRRGKPLVILCDTIPWNGVEPLKKRAPKLHYVRFTNEKELKEYQEVLDSMGKGV
jgi:transketolase